MTLHALNIAIGIATIGIALILEFLVCGFMLWRWMNGWRFLWYQEVIIVTLWFIGLIAPLSLIARLWL